MPGLANPRKVAQSPRLIALVTASYEAWSPDFELVDTALRLDEHDTERSAATNQVILSIQQYIRMRFPPNKS
jgi:hypothetical protein